MKRPIPTSSAPDSESGDDMRAALERKLDHARPTLQQEPPPFIPDHELLKRIGTGAYGEVWLARNALGTLRAVKVVYRSRFEDERPYHREFQGILKFEPVSRTHEGLVQVLHVGRNDNAGCFYYVMELADDAADESAADGTSSECGDQIKADETSPESAGPQQDGSHEQEISTDSDGAETDSMSYRPRTLHSEMARGRHLAPVAVAQLTLRLAEALGHLHANGLVHRDIKPSNVIFVSGKPKLADIGLVAGAGASRSFVGTEGFIPPEGPGSPQADIYGLGKLAYELVTGSDRLDFPQLPPGIAALPDGEALLELNEVITRACAPSQNDRYASAAELRADLSSFLAGRSLRDVRKAERDLAWLKGFAAISCGLLILGGLAVWLAGTRQRQAEARARTERNLRTRAELAERQTQQQLYTALLEQARATVRDGNLGHRIRALEAIRKAAAISNSTALRCEAFAAMALPDLQLLRTLPMDPAATLIQLDPKFERFAFCQGNGPVEIWSLSNQLVLATLAPSTNLPAYVARWSPDGRFLAVKRDRSPGGESADLEIWDLKVLRRVVLAPDVRYGIISFHPRLPLVLGTLRNGEVGEWDLESGKEVRRFQMEAPPEFLVFSPDGDRFAVSRKSPQGWIVSIHRSSDGLPLAAQGYADHVTWLDWHPSGRWVGVPDHSGTVRIMDAQSGEARALGRHKFQAVLTLFSPDGRYLMSGGWERELIWWDLRTMQRAFTISLNSFWAQFRSDGQQCALVSPEGTHLLTFEPPICRNDFADDLGGWVRRAVFSPDGRWLAAPGQDRLGLWDLSANRPAAFVEDGADAQVFFAPDSDRIYASRYEGCFGWQVTRPEAPSKAPLLSPLDLQKPEGFTSLCLVSNQIAITGSRGTRMLSLGKPDVSARDWISTPAGINGTSPDGRWLAIFRSFSAVLYVYSLPGFQPVAALTNQANIREFRFSPAGDELAICSNRGLQFWSTATWQHTRQLADFIDVLFPPEGGTFWLTKDFRHAGLYDASTLELLLPLPTGTLPLALSRDGRQLAVSVDARRLQVWNLADVRKQLTDLGLGWNGR